MQLSLDGFIEGPSGELDWIENWEDSYGIMSQVDACLLGAGMYPGYEQYWSAVLKSPGQPLPFSGKPATQGEIDYARFARRTPHYVLSKKVTTAAWNNTRFLRDIDEVQQLKRQAGNDIYAVGGAALVSALLEADVLDELRLAIHPIVLGSGKPLFADLQRRHALTLVQALALPSGIAELTYRPVR